MKASKIRSALSALIDSKIPSFLWGPSGIGKSSIVKQIAVDKKVQFIDLNLSLMDSTDLKDKHSSLLPKDGEGILFLNGINASSTEVQAYSYKLIFEREVGEYKLPDGWTVVAAGKRGTDEGSVYKMPTSLANRFVHLDMEVDVNDWKDWAFHSGIDERIIAYIAYKNEDLFTLEASSQERSFATPRSWELVSGVLRSGMDEPLLLDVLKGTVGKDSAISFLEFSKVAYRLPDIEGILQKGEGDYPTEPDVLYTLSTVLVSFLLKFNNEENLENVLKYILDLEPDFSVMIVQDLQRAGISMEHSESFVMWTNKFA